MIPTVGFNMRKITKGNVTIKVSGRKPQTLGTYSLGATEEHLSACWGGAPRRSWGGDLRPVGGEAERKQRLGEVGKELKTSEAVRGAQAQEGWTANQSLGGGGGRGAKMGLVACLLLRPCRPLLTQLWDIGGQPRFRSMWERYCRGVSAIV